MSDKPFSISRGIASLLNRGMPAGAEAEFHFATMREREKDPSLAGLALGARPGRSLHIPLSGLREVTVGGTVGATVGRRLERVVDLLEWSACVRAGANILTGLSANVGLARTTRLPQPEWIPEIGFAPSTDPLLGQVGLGPPWRVSGMINVTRQLLVSASPGLDQYLITGLARACSNQLDRAALYGVAANGPAGIAGTGGIHRTVIDWTDPHFVDFLEWERLVEIEDVGIANFAYLMHPNSKKILREEDRWGGGQADRNIWESITGPMSSMVVNDHKVFFGEFSQMTIGIWGDAADIIIDNFSGAQRATVAITASLFCNVAIDPSSMVDIRRRTFIAEHIRR